MKLLVACEESQTVCKAFRSKGHEAYSCDILEPSGGHPEWHILGDALEALEGGQVTTMDGTVHDVGQWDMLIAHPPCTYLSNVANRSFTLKCNVELFGTTKSGKVRTWEDTYSRDARIRSKTFPGIAKAMADQWG